MLRDKLLACNIPSATYNAILSEWANQTSSFAKCRRLSASAILFVIVRVASCEKSCKRVTPPLQLERCFIRHRCVASCKKTLPRETWHVLLQNVRDFPQSKLDSEINAPFLLNKHGDLYFLLHKNIVHIIHFNFSKI